MNAGTIPVFEISMLLGRIKEVVRRSYTQFSPPPKQHNNVRIAKSVCAACECAVGSRFAVFSSLVCSLAVTEDSLY